MMICNSCNATFVGIAKFCPKCGAKVVMEQQKASTKQCPQCGGENPISAKFCKVDGFRFDDKAAGDVTAPSVNPVSTAVTRTADMLVCPSCGTQNASNAKFCKKDGTPLGDKVSSIATTREVARAPESLNEKTAEHGSQQASIHASLNSASSKSKMAVVVGLITVLVATGVTYWYFIYRPANAEKIAEAPPIESAEIVPSKMLTPAIVKTNISKALAEAGLSKVSVTVDEDYDVELDGEVANDKEKTKAFNLVKSIVGVAYVTNNVLSPNDDPDAPWKPEDIAHMVNKEIAKSVGAGKTRPLLSPEELSVLRQTKGIDNPQTENLRAYDALIKAMRNVKEPLGHEKIQEILSAYPPPPPVAATPVQEIQVPESQPTVEENVPTPPSAVNVPRDPVRNAATVKQLPKVVNQTQAKKAQPAKPVSHVESPPITTEPTVPQAASVPQTPPMDEQKTTDQSVTTSAEEPKKHHGIRGLIERATGVDPSKSVRASEHQCTEAEKSMHTNGC